MGNKTQRFIEFGPFRLEAQERRLWRAGEVVPLPPKVFDLLVLLVRNPGHLLEKEQLLKALWPDSFVEESNLSVNVSALRRALGEDYIETVPKRGYRFTAEVREVQEPEPEAPALPARAARPKWIWYAVAAGCLAAAALGGSALWRLRAARSPLSEIRSIAVLPFSALDGNESQNYLGLGMADALITKLSSVGRLDVRPTNSVLAYTKGDRDALIAGKNLQVDALIEGRIQQSEKRIRITVQLLRVRDGRPLWADQFDDYFSNIFAVQDAISERLVAALSLRLSEAETQALNKRHTESTSAYQLYLQGQYLVSRRLHETTLGAIAFFQKAVAEDPDYAPPYAAMATSYIIRAANGWDQESREKARIAAMKAISLDEKLAEGHLALGQVLMRADWDWKGAERAFQRAIALDPRLAAAHAAHSTLLTAFGRHAEAIRAMETACRLDPSSAALRSDLAWSLHCARRYDEAFEESRKAVRMDGASFTARRQMGKAYLMKSMYAEALAEFDKMMEIAGGRNRRVLAEIGQVHAAAGRLAEARAVLQELRRAGWQEPEPRFLIAVLETTLGEKEGALQSLEIASQRKLSRAIWMKVDPELDALRSDPRFEQIVRRVGLEP